MKYFAIGIGCWMATFIAMGDIQRFSAVPSFTMRIDDNHPVADWERVAEIFGSRGIRVSFAVVPSGLSEEQGACLRRLAEKGHVIMDHTPNHTFYRATYHDRAAFDRAKAQPFVAEADEKAQKLYFRYEADESHPKNRRVKAKIAANRMGTGHLCGRDKLMFCFCFC